MITRIVYKHSLGNRLLERYDISENGTVGCFILGRRSEFDWDMPEYVEGAAQAPAADVARLFAEIERIVSCPDEVTGGREEPGYALAVYHDGEESPRLYERMPWTREGYALYPVEDFVRGLGIRER